MPVRLAHPADRPELCARLCRDGRFAPSPTGPLHLGSLRTAVVAWLCARSAGARFRVRIEDLDPDRSRAGWAAGQLADLAALGLDWDGPVVRQSQRTALYAGTLERLRAAGLVYPCFCSRAEVRAAASAPHGAAGAGAGPYPGTCRRLSEAERTRRIARGDRYSLRASAGGATVSFEDRLLGAVSSVVDDFVVRRADGVFAYQLAVVVDDAAQGIGEVVRGADLADSTPRQILLQRWLGLPTPSYAHVGLVLGADGARLAKRHGSVTLASRAAAREPVGVTLAGLAHSLGLASGRASVASAAELVHELDLAAMPRGPVRLASLAD